MAVTTSTIAATGGRSLTVYDAGDPSGAPILFHHGTPSSGFPSDELVLLAEEQGVRFLSYDRAGYGDSSRAAGRSVADVVSDIEAIADSCGVERFATWGLSGGGPHALACAALLPKRVAAAASAAGVAPYGAPGLDWLAGMGAGNVQEFGAALAGEETLRPALDAEAAGMATLTAPQLVEAMSTVLSAADVAALSGALGDHLLASFQRALGSGIDGWIDDDLAFARDWGFEPAAIEIPVLVVQGHQDLMVPPAHGRWLAETIPGVESRFEPDEGHITLYTAGSVRRINDWLLARP